MLDGVVKIPSMGALMTSCEVIMLVSKKEDDDAR